MLKRLLMFMLGAFLLLSASGCDSGGNTPPKVIFGPGGTTLTTPAGGLNGGATIEMAETSDTSGLVKEGETLVSKALLITTSSDAALLGDGTFSVSIPVDPEQINDVNKLQLKVSLSNEVSYPLFGVYDAKAGAFKVDLSGVKSDWRIAVVQDPSIQVISASGSARSSAAASLVGQSQLPDQGWTTLGWLTDPDWQTFEWHVVNHTTMSEADIREKILPVMWDTSEKLSKAGFRSPKIYIDPRLSPAARVVHIIGGTGPNDEGSHFAAGAIEYADGTWTYTEDQASFSSTLLDDEQLSALGQMYVNYDQFLNYNAKYGVTLGNIVIHELYHAVQNGYDVRKAQKSLAAYLEGTATPLGQTYQDTGGSVTGPSVSVRTLRPNEHARLYQAADDPTAPLQYTKQDFFVYVTKRYGGNSFAWTNQLFEYMNTGTSGKFGLTAAQYRELYRKAADETFNALFKKGFSKIYYEYALDRAYEHGADSVLRSAEETEANGFGKNHLAKTLFKWDDFDSNGLLDFNPATDAYLRYDKIEPLSCYAFDMFLPEHDNADSTTGFPLIFKLEGGEVLKSSDSGIKIVAFLEDENEDMVENGKIEITDVSKPVMIPFKEGAVNLTVLIMNCYLEDKNVKATVSVGPYIESASPNPAAKGDKVTLQGISFGASQGTSKLYFVDKEVTAISWGNTQITFTVPDDAVSGKVKVVVNSVTSNELQLEVGESKKNISISLFSGVPLTVDITQNGNTERSTFTGYLLWFDNYQNYVHTTPYAEVSWKGNQFTYKFAGNSTTDEDTPLIRETTYGGGYYQKYDILIQGTLDSKQNLVSATFDLKVDRIYPQNYGSPPTSWDSQGNLYHAQFTLSDLKLSTYTDNNGTTYYHYSLPGSTAASHISGLSASWGDIYPFDSNPWYELYSVDWANGSNGGSLEFW